MAFFILVKPGLSVNSKNYIQNLNSITLVVSACTRNISVTLIEKKPWTPGAEKVVPTCPLSERLKYIDVVYVDNWTLTVSILQEQQNVT